MKLLSFWLVLAILLIFPLGQLTRIEIFSPEIHIYWHDILIIALLFHCSIALLLKRRPFSISRLGRLIISFFVIGLFSLLLNSHRFLKTGSILAGLQGWTLLISSLYLFRWLAYAAIYFVILRFSKKQKRKVFQFMIFAGTAAAIFGLIQYFFFPDARSLVPAGWDPHLYRVIGTFLDPGFTGLIYVFTLILLVDLIWKKGCHSGSTIDFLGIASKIPLFHKEGLGEISFRKFKQLDSGRVTVYCLLFTVYSALALTYARSAYLAFIVAMLTMAYFKKSAKFGLAMILLLLATLPLLPRPAGEGVKLERQNSIWSRFNSWKNTITISRENPVFGVGFNSYRYVQAEKRFLGDDWQESHAGAGADSSLLLVLATTGITGLVVFLSLCIEVFRVGLRNLDYRLLATLVALFIHSFFNNSLFYPWVMMCIWVLLGITEVSSRGAKQRGDLLKTV